MDVEKTMGVCQARPEKSTHRVTESQSRKATGPQGVEKVDRGVCGRKVKRKRKKKRHGYP